MVFGQHIGVVVLAATFIDIWRGEWREKAVHFTFIAKGHSIRDYPGGIAFSTVPAGGTAAKEQEDTYKAEHGEIMPRSVIETKI